MLMDYLLYNSVVDVEQPRRLYLARKARSEWECRQRIAMHIVNNDNIYATDVSAVANRYRPMAIAPDLIVPPLTFYKVISI